MQNIPPELFEEIKEAVFAGRKIQAIKILRQHTGEGLKDTKELVERFEVELRRSHPEKFTKPKGCLGLVLVGGIALAVIAFLLVTRMS